MFTESQRKTDLVQLQKLKNNSGFKKNIYDAISVAADCVKRKSRVVSLDITNNITQLN